MSCFADPAVDGGHAVRQQHSPECVGPFGECPGCLPCTHDSDGAPVRHCPTCRTARHSHLEPGHTICGRCVTKLRAAMQDLLDAHALMPYEALADGINSDALSLAGPQANDAEWTRQAVAARRAGYSESDLGDDDTNWWKQLRRDESLMREWAGHAAYMESSRGVPGTIRYLQDLLPTLARHGEGPDLFRYLRATVSSTRSRLEAVLHNSRGPERGAPCPACSETLGIDGADPDAPKAPRLELHRADHDHTGASDEWRCPTGPPPGDDDAPHVWTAAAYRHRIGTDYRAHADWLTAGDVTAEHGVKAGTLKSWASRGQVRKKTDRERGVLYSVDDVKAARSGSVAAS